MTKHQIVKKLIEDLVVGYSNSFIILGTAGQGKTEVAFETLKELGFQEKEHFKYVANYITPRGLIDLLQEVNNLKPPKILILDDISTTLRNVQSIELLKGGLWEANGKRRIIWKTHRENIEFEFQGKIIIILNYLNAENPLIASLIDRSSFYEIKLTNQEIRELILEKAKKPFANIPAQKRQEIAQYVCQVGNNSKKFSLRLLPIAFSYFRSSPNHYKDLILSRL